MKFDVREANIKVKTGGQNWNNTITLRFQQYHKQSRYLSRFPHDGMYDSLTAFLIAHCSISQWATNNGQWDFR